MYLVNYVLLIFVIKELRGGYLNSMLCFHLADEEEDTIRDGLVVRAYLEEQAASEARRALFNRHTEFLGLQVSSISTQSVRTWCISRMASGNLKRNMPGCVQAYLLIWFWL